MEEMVNTNTGEVSRLDNLAMQARMFVQGACMNLLQLGRVLTEAKPLVRHGEWEAWIRSNTKMSRRTAEQYMQAYAEFGLNTQIAELGPAKVLKLLPMQQEEREKLLSENDVGSMSTRQLDEEIKKRKAELVREARAEVQEEIDRERNARIEAEQRAEERIKKQNLDMQEMSKNAGQVYREREKLQKDILDLKREIKDRDELLEEQQAEYNRMQEELLNIKSTIARGDAERIPADQLTPDVFASAVRTFIGACARMPHMGLTFSGMTHEEKLSYDELLETVESWAAESRKALETVSIEGTVFIHE